MKQKFITVNGKIGLVDGEILIRNLYFRFNRDFIRLVIFPLCWWVIFALRFYDEPRDAKWKVLIFFTGILAFGNSFDLYTGLFRRSYSNNIKLQNVRGSEMTIDRVGYITTVSLHLTSGRKRFIRFRTHENQAEAFVNAISPYLASAQIA